MTEHHRFATSIQLEDDELRRLYLPDDEWRQLIEVVKTAPTSDRLLVLTLLRTGMRPIELTRLRPCDLRMSRRFIRVKNAKKPEKKSKKSKKTYKPYRYVEVETAFLCELATFTESMPPDEPIWSVTRWAILRLVKRYMKCAGVPECRRTARALRHTFAVTFVVNKTPLPIIMKWMGHECIQTTMVYLQVLKDPRVTRIVETVWH